MNILNSRLILTLLDILSLSCLRLFLGHFFLDGPLDLIVCIGGMCTMIAIANYTFDTTSNVIVSSPKPDNDDNKI